MPSSRRRSSSSSWTGTGGRSCVLVLEEVGQRHLARLVFGRRMRQLGGGSSSSPSARWCGAGVAAAAPSEVLFRRRRATPKRRPGSRSHSVTRVVADVELPHPLLLDPELLVEPVVQVRDQLALVGGPGHLGVVELLELVDAAVRIGQEAARRLLEEDELLVEVVVEVLGRDGLWDAWPVRWRAQARQPPGWPAARPGSPRGTPGPSAGPARGARLPPTRSTR